MIIFTVITAGCAAVFAYMVGRCDGKDAAMDMYIHEQNKRVVAENEAITLKKEKIGLEDEVIDLQKKLAMAKGV